MEKHAYDPSEVTTSQHFSEFSEMVAYYAENDETESALQFYDDCLAYASHNLTVRDFIRKHPESVYRWQAVSSLVTAIQKESGHEIDYNKTQALLADYVKLINDQKKYIHMLEMKGKK